MNADRSFLPRLFGWGRWALSKALGVHVHVKVLGIALGVVLMLGTATILFLVVHLRRVLTHDLRQRADSIAKDAASRSTDFILTSNLYALYELLRETVANNPDVRYAFVVDPQGELTVHTFAGGFPRDLLTVNRLAPGERQRFEVFNTEEGPIHDVAVPIFESRGGTMHIGVSESRVRAQVVVVTWNLLLLTALAFFVGIGAAYLLTYVLTRPVSSLMEATLAVQEGDFSHRVKVFSPDELGQLSQAFNVMTEKLAAAESHRTRLVKQLLTAQEEERARIARELHDETGQELASLLVGLKVAEDAPTLDEARSHIGEMRKVAGRVLEEVRELAFETHPGSLDDLGLAVALERCARAFGAKFGWNVDCHVAEFSRERLPSDIELALYRILREALVNVALHAQAKNVSVLIQHRGEKVLAIIEDDGVGFDVAAVQAAQPERRFGLLGMEERARLVAGRVTIESTPGAGATVYIEVPLHAETREGNHADTDSHRG